MAKQPFILQPWLIAQLRRVSYRHPAKWHVKAAAKISRGLYTCRGCGQPTRDKDVRVDHIYPVIDPEVGFVDFNTFIARLFVPEDQLQVLCIKCHDAKSAIENKIRKETRKKKKEEKCGS